MLLKEFKNVASGLYRSSHQRCAMKKGVLRNFSKFTGKHLCRSLFFNKVAGLFWLYKMLMIGDINKSFMKKCMLLEQLIQMVGTHKVSTYSIICLPAIVP